MRAEYKTSDLSLAAFLRSNGLELSDVKQVSRGKSEFVFKDSPKRKSLVMQFFNQQGSVEPVGYVNSLKALKAMASQMSIDDMRERRG